MKIMGHYIDTNEKRNVIRMKMSCMDLMKMWKRCGTAANFGADYVSYSFSNKKNVENTSSMILNEMIENAAKYSNDHPDNIEVNVFIMNDSIVFQVDNLIKSEQFMQFQEYVRDIVNCKDLNAMYLQKMIETGESGDTKSGLGLLMIINNYNTTLGFKFEKLPEKDNYRVSVQTAMPVKGELLCS